MVEEIIMGFTKERKSLRVSKENFVYHSLPFLDTENKPENINGLEISLCKRGDWYEIYIGTTNVDILRDIRRKSPEETIDALSKIEKYLTTIVNTSKFKDERRSDRKYANQKFNDILDFLKNKNYKVHLWPEDILTLEEIKE